MQNPPPVQTAKSSTGLDENVAALLSYITWVLGLVFFLIEKDSRFVRFHAMQSILLNAAALILGFVIWFLLVFVTIIFAQISDVLGTLMSIVLGLLLFVFSIGILIAVVMCLIKAYQKQYFKLPIIGNFAEKFSMK